MGRFVDIETIEQIMGGLKHIYFLKNYQKHNVQKIRENNTLFNYLSDIKIRKWLLKIKPVEYIADMTEYL